MKKRILAGLVSLVLMAGSLAACGSAGEKASSAPESKESTGSSSAAASTKEGYATTLADIQAKGELVVGLDDTFAPMGFRDTSGNLVGFDIDLANAVAEKLGVKATFQPIDWDAKEMELSTGNIDCIWNGMSITPERQESMSLSQPYLNNRIVVMTNQGVQLTTKAELEGLNVGVQAGSAALEALKADEMFSVIEPTLTEYPTYDEIILAMASGREDCMVIDEVFGNYKNTQMENKLVVTDVDFGDDLYAIGFRKSDTELTQAVNDALNALIADGTAVEISKTWFGEDILVRPEGADQAASTASMASSQPEASSAAAA